MLHLKDSHFIVGPQKETKLIAELQVENISGQLLSLLNILCA